MSRRLLVSALPGERRAAWLEDGRLADYLLARGDAPDVLGDRYVGRVAALDRGLEAAFVELGLARPGLLALKPARVSEGAAVVVEVTRAPAAGKGPKLRLAADQAAAAEGRAPRLLARGPDPLVRALDERPPEEVVVDDAETLAALRRARPGLAERMRAHLEATPLFECEGVAAEVDALLQPEVGLAGGGRLWIEPTRALVAVDVDAGGRATGGGAGRLALETDLAAAAEVARQIRLRALSGLVVVDFLELPGKAERRRVAAALAEALAGDPEGASVSPMRASGLVEITRRRGRPALHELATEACGPAGWGRIRTAATVAFELLRAARREAAAQPAARLAAVAAPEVAAALEGGPAAAARAAVERRLGRGLDVQAEPGRPREDFEIVPRESTIRSG